MIGFGVFGYFLDRLKYPLISLIIGMIIGPLVEENFHRTLGMGYGSFHLLWTRPIAITFFVITFLFLAYPCIRNLYFFLKGKAQKTIEASGTRVEPEETTVEDIILLCCLAIFGLLMIIEGGRYPGIIGLFPVVTGYILIALIGWRSASMIFGRARLSSSGWRKPWLSLVSMSWDWSIGIMIVYFFLVYIIGFLGATALYVLAIPLMLRHAKISFTFVVGGGLVFCFGIFVKILHIVFPRPLLPIPF
jgi:hypothetical protein